MTDPNRRRSALPRARKRFGQHFLADGGVLRDIADRVTPEPGDLVLEIGPGRGALTGPLLSRLGKLVAVEIDRDLCAHLRQQFDGESLGIIEGDILRLDLQQLVADADATALHVVSNLPYNITAPVLFRLREHAGLVRRAILTLQKEVAQRLVAEPGTKAYSQLTVLLGQCARVRLLRVIPNTAFKPRPKVDSAVVEIQFEPQRVPVPDVRLFEVIVKAAFAQRRKMLRNTWKALPSKDNAGTIQATDLEQAAEQAQIDLTQRAEDLSIGQFARFAAILGSAQ